MKKHMKAKGKLLQANKKWSHLKAKQKEWISSLLREKYISVMEVKKQTPVESDCERILTEVLLIIDEKEIWIPSDEVRKYFNGKKIRWRNQLKKA